MNLSPSYLHHLGTVNSNYKYIL